MISHFILSLSAFITHTIDILGYLGVAILMAIESAGIPLPSEIIMPFSGFLVEQGRFTLFGLGLAGAGGSLVGSLLTYALGYFGGRRLIVKYGRYILITEHDLLLTENFFKRFGKASSFFARVIPIIRTFISIPAGIGKVPLWPFMVYTFLGSFIWSYFLAYLGLKLGQNWQALETYFHKFDLLIGIIIALLVIFWIKRHFKNRIAKL
ncbi:MAG TPA: DedA family protein [Patescibacteria group bacterium]|jgi:membrane protein DedA with SNARE-associated domain|nr:DedA family protein [Patescibacteria group bacterium]